MDTVEFHGLKVMRNFVRPNNVGWPSGRGDNYPETYRTLEAAQKTVKEGKEYVVDKT